MPGEFTGTRFSVIFFTANVYFVGLSHKPRTLQPNIAGFNPEKVLHYMRAGFRLKALPLIPCEQAPRFVPGQCFPRP